MKFIKVYILYINSIELVVIIKTIITFAGEIKKYNVKQF